MHSAAQKHTHEAALWGTMAAFHGTHATLDTFMDAMGLLPPATPMHATHTLDRDMLEATLDSMSDSGCAARPAWDGKVH